MPPHHLVETPHLLTALMKRLERTRIRVAVAVAVAVVVVVVDVLAVAVAGHVVVVGKSTLRRLDKPTVVLAPWTQRAEQLLHLLM